MLFRVRVDKNRIQKLQTNSFLFIGMPCSRQ